MSLETQIAVFLGSIALSMLFSFLWTVFHRVFFKWKDCWMRIPFEVVLFLLFAFAYYLFLVGICDGILNIQEGIALLIGIWIYHQFYLSYVLRWLERKAQKIYHIYKKIQKKIKKFFNKYSLKRYNKKRRRKKKYGEKKLAQKQ